MKYSKPPLSIDQQLDLLESRGLQIENRDQALHYLQHLNYYRLCAYWLPLEADHGSHRFKRGKSFSHVLNSYLFDRELRLLVLDAVERIEISIRTQWAYHFSHRHGPHGYLDSTLFKAKWGHAGNVARLGNMVSSSKETFICHLRAKYEETLPPIWAMVEIMSIGQLSKWIANMRHGQDRNQIAHTYGMDEVNMVSFLHHLSVIRNLCAHHNRLWNREFTFTFKLPRKTPIDITQVLNRKAPRKIYNTLTMLAHLMDTVCPNHHFRQRLSQLLEKYSVDEQAMGFPEGWHDMEFWK